jgi:hypothetical protein
MSLPKNSFKTALVLCPATSCPTAGINPAPKVTPVLNNTTNVESPYSAIIGCLSL